QTRPGNRPPALSNPVLGGAERNPKREFAPLRAQFPPPQPYRVTLEDSDFTEGAPGPLKVTATFDASVGGAERTTVTMNSWVNPSNLTPNFGPDMFPAGPLGAQGAVPAGSIQVPGPTVGLGTSSSSHEVQFTSVGPYSLFADVPPLIAFHSSNLILFPDDQKVGSVASAVPEPPALGAILTGLGLPWCRSRAAASLSATVHSMI